MYKQERTAVTVKVNSGSSSVVRQICLQGDLHGVCLRYEYICQGPHCWHNTASSSVLMLATLGVGITNGQWNMSIGSEIICDETDELHIIHQVFR